MSPARPATPTGGGPGRGRRRRYVAPPQNLGPSSEALFATPSRSASASDRDPDLDPPAAPSPARASSGGAVLPDRAAEDTGAAWGEREDGNDDRLHRDRPPHWE